MMRIAQISYFYRPVRGGQEVYINNLQRIFRSLGFRATVYQPNWGAKGTDVQVVPRIPLIGRIIPYASHHIFNLFLQLGYLPSLSQADAIIVHYPLHARPVWDLEGKVIVLSHGIEWNLDLKTHHDRYLERIGRDVLQRFTFVANDTHYFRHFGLNIKPGSSYFQEILPCKWFIPNCVNHRIFYPQNGIPEIKQENYILVPRQITQDRGILLAIEAFNIFIQKHQGYKLGILGQVPKNSRRYFKQCRQRVAQLGLERFVTFLPPVPNEHMPKFYSSAQITLIPTLRREGTSLSALESMACGTPTISTNVAGLRDLPTIQADPEPAALSEAITFVLNHHHEISVSQVNLVKEVFNLENWKNAWLRVIGQLTGKPTLN